MAVYSFDTDHAERFGLPESVVLYNLGFWIARNKAEGEHFHEGRTWTYNSVAGMAKLFPFFSSDQVRRLLESLRRQGVILTGHFSTDPLDRSTWYAFADESLLPVLGGAPGGTPPARGPRRFGKSAKSTGQNRQMDLADPPDASGDPARCLTGADKNRSDRNPLKTLNVGGEPNGYKRLVEGPVEAVVQLTGDTASVARYVQLRQICIEARGGGDAWTAAVRSLEKRIKRGATGDDNPLSRPGAYFDRALIAELDKRGIAVPTAAERQESADVGSLIAASLGLE